MRTLTSLTLAGACALAAACGGGGTGDDDDDTAPDAAVAAGTGTATLTFGVTNGVRQNPTLSDPLIGAVYGNVFLAEDVTLTGPTDDAMEFGEVELLAVDLEANTESAPWTTPELAPGTYVFLGFFDVDANGDVTREPDPGDPVTLPVSNQFEIVVDQDAELAAVFDLVYN
jgi:hypothetical protein